MSGPRASISLGALRGLLAGTSVPSILALALLTVIGGLTEGIGLLMLVPILELLQQPGAESVGRIGTLISGILGTLGIPLEIESLLLLFLALVSFRVVVQFAQTQVGARVQYRIVDRLRERVYQSLLRADWRWVSRHRRSDVASTLLNDVTRIGMGLQFSISLAVSLTTTLFYLTAAFALDPRLTLIAILGGILIILAVRGQQRAAFRLGWTFSDAHRQMMGQVEGSLGNLKLAKILGTEQRQLDFFLKVLLHLRQQQLRFTTSTSLTRALLQLFGALLLAGYLYLGLRWLATPVPELLILVLIATRLIPMLSASLQQSAQLLHTLPAAMETAQLLATAERQVEPAVDAAAATPTPYRSIAVRGVSVCYEGRERPALADVSLDFPVCTTTAILGASGAGKSTLADVLMGLLKPDTGELLIDGSALSEEERLRWRRAVAYVPQETFLFNDSIRNNLLWADPDADDTTLIAALGKAAAGFVLALPEGLDTLVGDGGIRLSGGERQRIALARALLKRPALILLDEATSALDLGTEAKVREALEQLHGDITVVMIGHRLATLEHADQVVILDQGRVIQRGTWEEARGYPISRSPLDKGFHAEDPSRYTRHQGTDPSTRSHHDPEPAAS